MVFKEFLKDRGITIGLICFGVITIEIFLSMYNVGLFVRVYTFIVILGGYFLGVFIEFLRKKQFYRYLFTALDGLEEKYLVTELMRRPNYMEEKLLKNVLDETNKSMLENVNKYKYIMEDYKEYVELWIHEIKLPIATSKLVVTNNKSAVTKSIDEELDKLEGYVEQALFYARSNTVDKDYFIKKCNLEKIVNECIKKNKNIIIQEMVTLELKDLDVFVYTDNKWVVFILTQVINNCIKYMKQGENKKIQIFARQNAENVVLYIVDNGIGIEEAEIVRVFEKGFTGTNGRIQNKKSTGIGLYLCKKLCIKLGIEINLRSKKDNGTEVRLIFPKSSYIDI